MSLRILKPTPLHPAASWSKSDISERLFRLEKALARKTIESQVLAVELRNIANADPSKWGEDSRDQFQAWAQNRARHALALANARQ